MKITRIYADEHGDSHFEDLDIPLTDQGDIGRMSDQFNATGIIFRTTDGDYHYDWHTAPQRQYIIILEGKVETTVSDGETRTFQDGDIVLVEDVTGKGHISRSPDGRPRRSIFVTLE